MGPYGSVWAYIKTGRSHMAQDHFQTPPDPPKGYNKCKNDPKTMKTGWGRAGIVSRVLMRAVNVLGALGHDVLGSTAGCDGGCMVSMHIRDSIKFFPILGVLETRVTNMGQIRAGK